MRRQIQTLALPVWQRVGRQLNQCCRQGEQWLRRQADVSQSCRECRNRVQLFTEICPHCGAANPSRVPVALIALGGGAMLACLALAALAALLL